MQLSTIPCGPIQANCYIISDEDTRNCIVIDPGDAAPVINCIKAAGLSVSKILLTHGHFDHCMGVAELKKETGAEVLIHKADEELINGRTPFLSAMQFDLPPFQPSGFLDDGSIIQLDSLSFKVLHTPGHSKGSVCFVDENNEIVFSGDTLFLESIGRTDLYGGSMNELFRSVFESLFKLPEHYKVFPGHGETTSVEHEKKYNPLVNYSDYFKQFLQ